MKVNARIKFTPKEKSLFFATLKGRVDDYFIENEKSKNFNAVMVVKTVVLLSAYILPFVLLMAFLPSFGVSLVLWFVMGIGIAGIGMSVMHDANHGSYSQNPIVNKWLGNTINLAGAGVSNWKWQHNILHHTYTNIASIDEDIRDRGVITLSPKGSVPNYHRFQWVYAFLFYGLLTIYWVTFKDFLQYFSFIKSGINRQTGEQNLRMLTGLIAIKVLYFLVFFVVPVYGFGIPFIQILAGFLLMHFTAGLVLSVIFQLAHSVEGTAYPVADSNGVVEKDWAIHQLETTVNFSKDNKWLGWYIGGLNFQIEHHLFPKICHVHYPALSGIVKKTAHEFGLRYLENKTFGDALESHIASLRKLGIPKADEVIG